MPGRPRRGGPGQRVRGTAETAGAEYSADADGLATRSGTMPPPGMSTPLVVGVGTRSWLRSA
ncbi:hypothetical protein SCWH03_03360 [Streptomyces pacificus]|uniref:Uncharacterized protein n=1 Tax=Streptomyces pacificus TaxID=2705029 RepID=A0A6A0ANE3_9ACTN|nr:hypothetical protein SCWH03_03360 [Streptomyces pacificus]